MKKEHEPYIDFRTLCDVFDTKEYIYTLIACVVLALLDIALIGFALLPQTLTMLRVFLSVYAVLLYLGIRNCTTLPKALNLFWRLRKVPAEKKQKAKLMYADDWRDISIECHEAHIPGDCPLCGAE